ncbi:endonuclease/exonuclease/phosphatase family protein [Streptomyces sp. NPDC059037]|uniref:endonuclease/exonuclease/phosphatase family protein n=1 Tax=Streptomyces sp. NPDC059037 TaxID=3346710 RepID=UPI003698C449
MLIATWNLENFFLPGGKFGPRDAATYEAKLASLAAGITELSPDLLAVQEVGDPQALDELADLTGGTWHRALSEYPDDRGTRVGFLSRLPLTTIADTVAFHERMRPVQSDDSSVLTSQAGRGVLAVRVEPDGGPPIDAAVCHLKSKLLSYPGGRSHPRDEEERARFGGYAMFRRTAEAVALRALANRLLEGDGREKTVVVLGDLNDGASAATSQILCGPSGSELGTAGFNRPDHGDGSRLWNLAPLIPAGRRHSRIHAGRPELIDHILVSHRLVFGVEAVGTGVSDTAPYSLPSIDDDPLSRRDATEPDHAPVWVRLYA